MRADLHALFDCGHLAVHPESGIVYISPEARDWGEYGELHGRVTLACPRQGWEAHAPTLSAFKTRWEQFLENGRDRKACWLGGMMALANS